MLLFLKKGPLFLKKVTKILKANYLKKVNTKEKIVLIDDDNQVLKVVNKEVPDVILYQDSVLVD